MRESSTLEFKRSYTKTFLKTVSAFANYGDGEILFGVDDDGSAIGVEDPDETALRIENAINDALDPVPDFSITEEEMDGEPIVRLAVREGGDKPYLASGRAYRRTHTSTVQVDHAQLLRLARAGEGISFEELPASSQELEFTVLDRRLEETLGLNEVNDGIYRTLGLRTAQGFNNAAAALADTNRLPGIDTVRFGSDISEILDRDLTEGVSALIQYDRALEAFRRHYVVERIEGAYRTTVELIPEVSFREAVANALAHRRWNLRAAIRVSMYGDAIEVTSPGGLPEGVDEDLYLAGGISELRNPIIGNVLFRLGLIERLGTGVRRIREGYRGALVQPSFTILDGLITVRLPVTEAPDELNPEEIAVLRALRDRGASSRPELEQTTELSQSKLSRILRRLVERGLAHSTGAARSTRYSL